MKKKETAPDDYTIIFHMIVVILIIGIGFACFCIAGRNNVNKMVENTGHIYQEKIEDSQKITPDKILNKGPQKSNIPFEKYDFNYMYTLNVTGEVKNLVFQVPLPSDEIERQYITSLKITPAPSKTYRNKQNNIAEFRFNSVTDRNIDIVISGNANIRSYDLYTAKSFNKNFEKEADLKQYLSPAFLIESNDGLIKRTAKSIKGETQEEIVKNIYDYVQKIVRYRPASNDLGAKQTLLYRYGKCSEFSALMVALCRARNIPARIVIGNIAREQNQKHVWVEVYFDKYGWVMFDPTANGSVVNTYVNGKLVQKESRFNANKTFMKYIASGRNEFSPWYISYSIGERRNGNITVGENIQIVKSNK